MYTNANESPINTFESTAAVFPDPQEDRPPSEKHVFGETWDPR